MLISKRQIFILFSIAVLLAVPFVAMQFSSEVNWSLFDFIGAGILLSIIGFTIDFVHRKTRSRNKRSLILLAIFILFLLVWIELAVGLFNTPFAGN
ncbi:hypothetical protein MACH07_19690 [Flagellimonas marinaquae]|uniref:Uncharacterized protein n=1 Tax=Flagellimonas marinaquae TaxID=254955 RepID=A0AA48KLH7_9FLAO|nr:hypothetical protein [Allomuricauda aquimarina]USD24273.1 hypothetical protein MJO53_11355 [Allomuricauda aquimarina]BDW93137.1 hypothetical protein MACH07_19690 [Allomuricauda aquimarina]